MFSTYRESGVSERKADNLLGWASHPKYQGKKLGFSRIRTLSRAAVKAYLPSGVQSANFTEKEDGAQKIIFLLPRPVRSGQGAVEKSQVCRQAVHRSRDNHQ